MNLTGKTLNTNKELINAKMIFCMTCGDHFDQLEYLSSHIETNLACKTKDNVKFLSYQGHRSKSKVTKYKQCAMCDYKYHYKSDFNRHIKNVHRGKDVQQCPFCGKDILSGYLRTHITSLHSILEHTNFLVNGKYQCPKCDLKFIRWDFFRKHLDKMGHHSMVSKKTEQIGVCEKDRVNKLRSNAIPFNEIQNSEVKFGKICPNDGLEPTESMKKLKQDDKKENHSFKLKTIEIKAEVNTEIKLEKQFEEGFEASEQVGIGMIAGIDRKDINGEKISNQLLERLTKKLRKIFKCIYCESEFSFKNNLKAHMKRNHEENVEKLEIEKISPDAKVQLDCSSEVLNSNITIKEELNCGPRDYFCALCSLQFNKKSVYDLHVKLVHPDYNKTISKHRKKTVLEKCPICQASFANFSNSKSITQHINKCRLEHSSK